MKPKQLGAASGNIAVTAEVRVNLPGECINANYGCQQIRAELPTEGRIGEQSAVIGNHALPEKAQQNQHAPVEEPTALPVARILDLRQKMGRPLDRPCDQMREQADEESVVEQRPRGFLFPVIDIDDII
jgi:hypothetical protein